MLGRGSIAFAWHKQRFEIHVDPRRYQPGIYNGTAIWIPGVWPSSRRGAKGKQQATIERRADAYTALAKDPEIECGVDPSLAGDDFFSKTYGKFKNLVRSHRCGLNEVMYR